MQADLMRVPNLSAEAGPAVRGPGQALAIQNSIML